MNREEISPAVNAQDELPALYHTGESVRLAARSGELQTFTSSLAPTYLQVNLIALPSRYASEFRLLCQRNPVPCPLLAETKSKGGWYELQSWIEGIDGEQIAGKLDLRYDFPKYMVYENGVLTKPSCLDVASEWTEDHVGFLIGCSYSFESALIAADLTPSHVAQGTNVPMYRTSIPLCPVGIFKHSTYVVSMRPYKKRDVEQVREITRPFLHTHGEPLDWGWDAIRRLGIRDISSPEWGDAPVTLKGAALTEGVGESDDQLIPVFWGCGVTPQEAVMKAKLEGTVIGHAPGHMLLLDIRDWEVLAQIPK